MSPSSTHEASQTESNSAADKSGLIDGTGGDGLDAFSSLRVSLTGGSLDFRSSLPDFFSLSDLRMIFFSTTWII